MNTLSNYITEKLKLDKDIKISKENYDTYWTDEMEDYENMPNDFFEHRKSTRKIDNVVKNRPWYAVCVCLSENGPMKKDEIRNLVWPNNTGQQSELFMGLHEYCIIERMSGPDRGKIKLREFRNWVKPIYPKYKLW